MHTLLSIVNLPFVGEVNLPGSVLLIFFVCLLFVVAFEFVKWISRYGECGCDRNLYQGIKANGSRTLVRVFQFSGCFYRRRRRGDGYIKAGSFK